MFGVRRAVVVGTDGVLGVDDDNDDDNEVPEAFGEGLEESVEVVAEEADEMETLDEDDR
jgi:hypothetical protein